MTDTAHEIIQTCRELSGDTNATVTQMLTGRQAYFVGEAKVEGGRILWSASTDMREAAMLLLSRVLTHVGVARSEPKPAYTLMDLVGEAKALMAARALGSTT